MRPPALLLGLSKDSDEKCLSGVPGGQTETPSSPGQLSGVRRQPCRYIAMHFLDERSRAMPLTAKERIQVQDRHPEMQLVCVGKVFIQRRWWQYKTKLTMTCPKYGPAKQAWCGTRYLCIHRQ